MACHIPIPAATRPSSAIGQVSDDIEGMREVPHDVFSPRFPPHPRGRNVGSRKAPCPGKGGRFSASDGINICSTRAIDLGNDLMNVMNAMSFEAESGLARLSGQDVDDILKALEVILQDGNWPTCDGKPSRLNPEAEMDDEDETASLSSDITAGDTTSPGDRFKRGSLSRARHTKYRCATEAHGCAAVRIGCDGRIPRWRRGSELSYVVCTESFPHPLSLLVEDAMKEAIAMWEGIGVSFRQASRNSPATFAVKYEVGVGNRVYACSFFPGDSPAELFVYRPSGLEPKYLPSILAHEIGHVLGLRHDFAHQSENKNPSVRIGEEDNRSIMRYYDHLAKLQVSKDDLQGLREFYAFDQEEYKELAVIDFEPELHDFSEDDDQSYDERVRPMLTLGFAFIVAFHLFFGLYINDSPSNQLGRPISLHSSFQLPMIGH